MTFREAVEACDEPVASACQNGKQALKGEHRSLIDTDDPSRFMGSVDLDAALQHEQGYGDAARWDYGIGFLESEDRETAIWVEVHPANTGQVTAFLNKLQWLKRWLREHAPSLRALTRIRDGKQPYYWVATSKGVHISKNSPQARRLAAAGISMPRRRLDLE